MSAPSTAIDVSRPGLFPRLSGAQAVAKRLQACAQALHQRLRVLGKTEPSQPADRWLQENFSFLQLQIRDTRRNLRPVYIRKLLRAEENPSGDEPRIYRIAAVEAAQATSALTPENMPDLAEALRQHSSLKLCELWAFSSMLRFALLEKLCAGLDSEPVVSSCIQSLRSLENLSWRDFVESVSLVETALRSDPAGIYPRMDFETRDRYRHEIEKLARRSRRTELAVAEAVIERSANMVSRSGVREIETHVGYHLIGVGAADFARSLGSKHSLGSLTSQLVERWPGLLYASSFMLIAALIVALFDRFAGPLPWWMIGLLLVPASQIALEVVNSVVCHCVEPRPLPSLDFSQGIPDSSQTIVAVPALLLSSEVAARLVENLEIRYLANCDPNLLFALVTDFPDADQCETAADAVLDICVEGVNRLNAAYGAGARGPFYLFHRSRQWNPKESKWMGHERKRGKLNNLNELLLGQTNHFDVVVGDRARFPEIRYVITLDADTQLPRDTAAKLIAGMAHPLNRPVLNPTNNTVLEGYGLIRPRVSVSMESAGRSLFSQIFSGMAGFDPYATAVSDVYQDFFGLTSFTGKGIYDLRAFDAAVGDRFPDNAILSHDLIEGEHVRTGFLPSVELVEDYPASYQAFCKRKHRWARGDWQLLPWLFSAAGCAGALEVVGQPPQQSGRNHAAGAVGGRLDFFRPLRALDPDGAGAVAATVLRRHPTQRPENDRRELVALRAGPGGAAGARPPRHAVECHFSAASSLPDGRRDRTHAVSPICYAPQAPRMGNHGAVGVRQSKRSESWKVILYLASAGAIVFLFGAGKFERGRLPILRALDSRAAGCLVAQPAAACARRPYRTAIARSCDRPLYGPGGISPIIAMAHSIG